VLEHLNQAARRVVAVADEEARMLGHGAVGTGHLLLGLLAVDDDGVTANLLWGCDLTVDLVRAKVAALTSHAPPNAPAPMKLTERAQRSIGLAHRAARLQGRAVGTDHLLLGVIELGEGVAIRVLESSAIDLANLEAAVVTTQGLAPGASEGKSRDLKGDP
jgi:ATP-dependent Clp protease ATP-binding subunit ClpC